MSPVCRRSIGRSHSGPAANQTCQLAGLRALLRPFCRFLHTALRRPLISAWLGKVPPLPLNAVTAALRAVCLHPASRERRRKRENPQVHRSSVEARPARGGLGTMTLRVSKKLVRIAVLQLGKRKSRRRARPAIARFSKSEEPNAGAASRPIRSPDSRFRSLPREAGGPALSAPGKRRGRDHGAVTRDGHGSSRSSSRVTGP